LKSTETFGILLEPFDFYHFSNFGSLKSTETHALEPNPAQVEYISAISAR